MLTHSQIWQAIDNIARNHSLSPSRLARLAGLDSTTFNKSKRITKEGHLRWPGTEVLAKVLQVTDTSLWEFWNMLERETGNGFTMNIPLIGLAKAGHAGYFDDAGYPIGGGWDEINFPVEHDANVYALEISGDSMEPAYREGDILLVSPGATIRRKDRVVLKTTAGDVMAKELLHHSTKRAELASLNPTYEPLSIPAENISWISRILWISQ